MSAHGTKRTYQSCRSMSAFGGKADVRGRWLRRPRLWSFIVDRGHKGTGQRAFGRCHKPIFVASHKITQPKESRRHQWNHDGRERVVKLKKEFAKEVAADAERRGPDNSATGIGDQKRAPRHAVHSGEERRQHAQ